MQARTMALFLVSLIALFASFAYSFYYPTFNGFISIPITIMIITFFLFGALGFGYLSFVPHIFLGLAMGASRNALLFVYLIPILFATYAGVKLGSSLTDDFRLKDYFTNNGKVIITFLLLAIIIAIIIEFSLPIIMNMHLIPEDLLGLHINTLNTGNIFDLLNAPVN